jgi:Zn-finger nucleic acid-binding protein
MAEEACMKCVKCTGQTSEVRVSGIVVDRCERCHGIWFDKSELDRVLESIRSGAGAGILGATTPLAEKLDNVLAHCPRCGQELARSESVALDGLFYDSCGGCGGAWLDGGELAALSADGTTSAIASFFAKFDAT